MGVMNTNDAIRKAREEDMDLVLMVPNANPPVAKIVEFTKFLYEEKKKANTAKAKSKKTDVKEFRLGPTTGEGDIQRFVKRAKGFIEDGDKVKITVKMRGREVMFPEVAYDQIKKIEKELTEVAKLEMDPKRMGNIISAIFVGK
jgi:translation initiation factor IF-3